MGRILFSLLIQKLGGGKGLQISHIIDLVKLEDFVLGQFCFWAGHCPGPHTTYVALSGVTKCCEIWREKEESWNLSSCRDTLSSSDTGFWKNSGKLYTIWRFLGPENKQSLFHYFWLQKLTFFGDFWGHKLILFEDFWLIFLEPETDKFWRFLGPETVTFWKFLAQISGVTFKVLLTLC